MAKRKMGRRFTAEEDELISSSWPDHREAAYSIDDKSTLQVYDRGSHLGMPSKRELNGGKIAGKDWTQFADHMSDNDRRDRFDDC